MYTSLFFFFNDPAPPEIYTLSLHDALPIFVAWHVREGSWNGVPLKGLSVAAAIRAAATLGEDRKSTRLNSSHGYISYAVFCLKKKKKEQTEQTCLAALTVVSICMQ